VLSTTSSSSSSLNKLALRAGNFARGKPSQHRRSCIWHLLLEGSVSKRTGP
jgi:hypothetical protein